MALGYYFNLKDVFTKEECDRIINSFSDVMLKKSDVEAKNITTIPRKNKTAWVEMNVDNDWIYQRLQGVASHFNKENYKFNLEWARIELIQFTKYEKGDYYTWHMDLGNNPNTIGRKISLVVQLSDAGKYDGGELQIGLVDEEAYTAYKDKGSVAIFPSTMRHRVSPVTRGVRYSLVAWVCGVPFV